MSGSDSTMKYIVKQGKRKKRGIGCYFRQRWSEGTSSLENQGMSIGEKKQTKQMPEVGKLEAARIQGVWQEERE